MRIFEKLEDPEVLIREKVKQGFSRTDAVISLWYSNKIPLPWLKSRNSLWFPILISGDQEMHNTIMEMVVDNGSIDFWANVAKSSIPVDKDLLIREVEKQLESSWMCIYALKEFRCTGVYPEITDVCLSKLKEFDFVFDEWKMFVGDNKKFRKHFVDNVIKHQESITNVYHWLWINNNLREINDLAKKKLGLRYD